VRGFRSTVSENQLSLHFGIVSHTELSRNVRRGRVQPPLCHMAERVTPHEGSAARHISQEKAKHLGRILGKIIH
jgi:hypothetical protein